MASRRLALGSLVRAKTKSEAERVGKYMLRPVLGLERLTFLEPEGQVGYRWGRDGAEQETAEVYRPLAGARGISYPDMICERGFCGY